MTTTVAVPIAAAITTTVAGLAYGLTGNPAFLAGSAAAALALLAAVVRELVPTRPRLYLTDPIDAPLRDAVGDPYVITDAGDVLAVSRR